MPLASRAHQPALANLLDPRRLAGGASSSDVVDPAVAAEFEQMSGLPLLPRFGEAIFDGTTSMNWGEYVDAVGRLASVLLGCDVAPGDRVGVRLDKSVWSFVAVHGVLRAGAVMVPVDPLASREYAAAVLADAGVKVLITGQRLVDDVIAETGVQTFVVPVGKAPEPDDVAPGRAIRIVGANELASAQPVAAVERQPTDPAYVIYTSGSTGTPKGIVHSHASAMAYAVAAAEEYALGAADRLANIAPLHFDQSTFELYAAPLVGAAVLAVPDPVLRFPASLSAMIAEHRVSVWYSVPYVLIQMSTRGALADRDLSALRLVLFGGESFPPGLLRSLMAQLPGVTFSNVYGPAEVNQCTAFHFDALPPDLDNVPIGRPWDRARVRIADPDDLDRDATPGQPGILLVSTDTMMTGYWRRPDLTVTASWTGDGEPGRGARWYVTGDLVVEHGLTELGFDTNGGAERVLVFLGRADNQVKVRGFRIELEAVDSALCDVDVVSEGTVVVVRDDRGDDRLVGLVVLDPSVVAEPAITEPAITEPAITEPAITEPAITEGAVLEQGRAGRGEAVKQVIAALHGSLPRYSVPSEVHAVESLPRTGSGKVDRVASSSLLDTFLLSDSTRGPGSTADTLDTAGPHHGEPADSPPTKDHR